MSRPAAVRIAAPAAYLPSEIRTGCSSSTYSACSSFSAIFFNSTRIPIYAATIAISEKYDKDIRYCSNRKEVKDHGDKGILLGSPIQDGDKVIIIEDVTTAGTSIQETLPIIKAQGDVEVGGLVVSVDRMERGQGEKSALTEISEKYGMKTTAIVTMAEVVEHLYNKPYKGKVIIDDELKKAIDAYYDQYGVK